MNLNRHARRKYSQHGEDGILEAIYGRIGVTNRFAVEFGCGDGGENCSRNLIEHHGWGGLWIDRDRKNLGRAMSLGFMERVRFECRHITAENVAAAVLGYGSPIEPDLLVVDLDGNDHHVIGALLRCRYRPRVVVAEFNRHEPPYFCMAYEPGFAWDGKDERGIGQGLGTLCQQMLAFGYRLVCVEAVNAFFVRDSIKWEIAE